MEESILDRSDLSSNRWFTGFTEADGHFGIKIVSDKPKSETRKRSVSNNISLRFNIDQRLNDKITCSSMMTIMKEISIFLSSSLKVYKTLSATEDMLCVSVASIDKFKLIVHYFSKHTLFGIKKKNFNDWLIVYNMILDKQHLTGQGREKIKIIQSNTNSKRKPENLVLKYSI